MSRFRPLLPALSNLGRCSASKCSPLIAVVALAGCGGRTDSNENKPEDMNAPEVGGTTTASSEREAEWILQWGTEGSDSVQDVAVDDQEQLYVCGRTDSGLESASNRGSFDAFLQKFNSEGELIWTAQTGSAGWDTAQAVALPRPTHVAVVGFSEGVPDGDSQQYVLATVEMYNTADGTLRWRDEYSHGIADRAVAVTTSDDGDSIWVAGTRTPIVPGLAQDGAGVDIFLREFDVESGEVLHDEHLYETGNEFVSALAVYNDSLLVSGRRSGGEQDGLFLELRRLDDLERAHYSWRPSDHSASLDAASAVSAEGHIALVGEEGSTSRQLVGLQKPGELGNHWFQRFETTDFSFLSDVVFDEEAPIVVGSAPKQSQESAIVARLGEETGEIQWSWSSDPDHRMQAQAVARGRFVYVVGEQASAPGTGDETTDLFMVKLRP